MNGLADCVARKLALAGYELARPLDIDPPNRDGILYRPGPKGNTIAVETIITGARNPVVSQRAARQTRAQPEHRTLTTKRQRRMPSVGGRTNHPPPTRAQCRFNVPSY